jgi:hypothetical protein
MVEGCNRQRYARGLCQTHYRRWERTGEVGEAAVRKRGTWSPPPVAKQWMTELLARDDFDDACVLWPFSTNERGRPQLQWDGKNRKAAAVVCAAFHGPRPEGMEACHSCPRPGEVGLGNELCMNPRHLRWCTRQENLRDQRTSKGD